MKRLKLKPRFLTVSEQLMPDQKADWGSIRLHISRYAFAIKFASARACLDLACGYGYGSNYLIRNGAKVVVGGDISKKCIDYAKAHYISDGLYYLILDAQRLPFQNEAFDTVISFETIEHLENPGQFLTDCYRILKPGGQFICSTPNKAMTSPYTEKPIYPYHVKEFCIDELCSLAEGCHFREIAIYGLDFCKGFRLKYWKIYRYLSGRIMPLFSALPKGEYIAALIRALISTFTRGTNKVYHPRQRYIKVDELSEKELQNIAEDLLPLPLEDSLGEPIYIVLVARR